MIRCVKLSAGSGYDYLTRQVAALDATEKGHVGLASYYTERGESPGNATVRRYAKRSQIRIGLRSGPVVDQPCMLPPAGVGEDSSSGSKGGPSPRNGGKPDDGHELEIDGDATVGQPYPPLQLRTSLPLPRSHRR
jgi:hypothetical protein